MEFNRLLDLLELNWMRLIVQELDGCIGIEYEWNDSTLEIQFQSPGNRALYSGGPWYIHSAWAFERHYHSAQTCMKPCRVHPCTLGTGDELHGNCGVPLSYHC